MEPTFFIQEAVNDAPKNRVKVINLDEDVALAPVENREESGIVIQGELNPRLIQFYFCMQGEVEFVFHRGQYRRKLEANRSFLFYNPEGPLAHEVHLGPHTRLLTMFVSVKRLHHWFVQDSGELTFLNNDNINQRLYAELPISSSLAMVIGPLFLVQPPESTRNLFFRAKVMEILSLYFTQGDDNKDEKCPFLHDESNVEKIREVKQIVRNQMTDPPGLKELARLVGLNEYQLKVGFKNIYGTTVYKYLTDYRMDQARKMLDSGKYLVNEAAAEVGYSNPSHFIAAFKKKYGFTPKKYLGFVRR
ncbi:MAG: AraC family transcriptional regulator [Bacteroidia bacterium]|nr:AraC family transcriptional regulator [Bacteroidia bacterium]